MLAGTIDFCLKNLETQKTSVMCRDVNPISGHTIQNK